MPLSEITQSLKTARYTSTRALSPPHPTVFTPVRRVVG
jgi:hypothetical protein